MVQYFMRVRLGRWVGYTDACSRGLCVAWDYLPFPTWSRVPARKFVADTVHHCGHLCGVGRSWSLINVHVAARLTFESVGWSIAKTQRPLARIRLNTFCLTRTVLHLYYQSVRNDHLLLAD